MLRQCLSISPGGYDRATTSCVLSFVGNSLFFYACLLSLLFDFLHVRTDHSWPWRWSLKITQLFCAPFFPGDCILWDSSKGFLNRAKSDLLKCRVVILLLSCSLLPCFWISLTLSLHPWMPPTSMHPTCSSLLKRQVQQNAFLHRHLGHLPYEMIIHVLQKPPVLLGPCCVPFQQILGIVNIPHKDQGLWMWGFL